MTSDFTELRGSNDPHQKAELLLGPVEWVSESEGLVACPGEAFHTHRTGKRDCKLYLNDVPTLTCFHASCRESLVAKNTELRRVIAGPSDPNVASKRRKTPEEKLRLAEIARREQLRVRATHAREQILKSWAWPYASILAESPVKLDPNAHDHWRSLLSIYDDGDVVWIGSIYDSGKPEHVARFRTKESWLESLGAPGQFTCPAVFKPGSHVRGNNNVIARRFLVVESDELNKDQVGGIFRWLAEKVGLKLRAIVDTAGKSLHGWYDYPSQDNVADLKIVLPQLGCDPKLFTASQPVRLPGALRGGNYQRLVWLAQGGAR